MKYFLIMILFLNGCSVTKSVYTGAQVSDCSELSKNIIGSSFYLSSENCIITVKYKGWSDTSYRIPLDHLIGAQYLQLIYTDIEKYPSRKYCKEKCLKAKKNKRHDENKKDTIESCHMECY